ncbi:DUF262 domain-containing protein [Actinoplanes sp. NPDC023936]|uniref:DUF262 domain-containing protein n=1 Tax=Actinoplanes sp. NPDC023936 TaxID=3154910 RepID=UPI00340F9499
MDAIVEGRFRLPPFHRPYVWTAEQVVPFFESILAGRPTGMITIMESPAGPSTEWIGPVRITAPGDPSAWLVIDGSQRLGTLAGALLAVDKAGSGAIRLAYDLSSETLIPQREPGEPLDLPLDAALDPYAFHSWLNGLDSDPLVERALEIRSRILDYRVGVVRIAHTPLESAAEIFVSLNNGGVRLNEADLFHTRRPGNRGVAQASDPAFGPLPDSSVLETMILIGSWTPRLSGSSPERTTDALRRATAWLSEEAGIPHLTVWENHLALLPVLAGFFDLNPNPSARARVLLDRWLWRSMGYAESPGRQPPLHGADSLDVAELLRLLPATIPEAEHYLARAGTRLALSTLEPRSLLTGEPLPIAGLLQARGSAVFREFAGSTFFSPPEEGPLEELLLSRAPDRDVLASHAVGSRALSLLRAGDLDGFDHDRSRLLASEFFLKARRRAQWGASDRPAISDLLISDEPEDADSHAR